MMKKQNKVIMIGHNIEVKDLIELAKISNNFKIKHVPPYLQPPYVDIRAPEENKVKTILLEDLLSKRFGIITSQIKRRD